nr:MAG TPA: hypothetical protein [Caudoviricetes sp.]DAL70917.1 MAG TPA: hypothetical protein [Caudoviricetes sp.]
MFIPPPIAAIMVAGSLFLVAAKIAAKSLSRPSVQ